MVKQEFCRAIVIKLYYLSAKHFLTNSKWFISLWNDYSSRSLYLCPKLCWISLYRRTVFGSYVSFLVSVGINQDTATLVVESLPGLWWCKASTISLPVRAWKQTARLQPVGAVVDVLIYYLLAEASTFGAAMEPLAWWQLKLLFHNGTNIGEQPWRYLPSLRNESPWDSVASKMCTSLC